MQSFRFSARRSAFSFAALALLCAALALPGAAQNRAQMANTLATDAGNKFVAKISGESCADFAASMQQMKGSGSSTSSKLKSNPQARTTFVNIVAAPLLNKMIDCGMMPGNQ